MDFTLTDEQKDLRELAHNFAEKEIRTVAWDYDKDGTWPQEIIEKAWEVGLMNTHVPEEYGGPGLDFLSGCLIEEEFGWGCSGIGTSLAANGLAMTPVALGGSEEIKAQYLGMLDRGAEARLVLPHRARRRLRRLRDEDDGHEAGRQVRHQRLQVLHHQRPVRRLVHGLREDRQGRRPPRHLRLRRPPRRHGRSIDKKEDKLGQRASNTATVTFNETEIPAENLLGEENKGFKLAMMTLDRTRPGVAAMAVGIGRAAFEFACEYSKERVQFGVPIAMHQAVAFMIADMATKVEAGRLLTWQSAALLDQGIRNTLACSHAKRFAADSAMEITIDAVQVYGGYGFIKDYPVEKLMRDAKIMQLYEGTSQIQRLVIAKEVLMGRNVNEPLPEAVERRPTPPPRSPRQAAAVASSSRLARGAQRVDARSSRRPPSAMITPSTTAWAQPSIATDGRVAESAEDDGGQHRVGDHRAARSRTLSAGRRHAQVDALELVALVDGHVRHLLTPGQTEPGPTEPMPPAGARP